MSEKSSPMARGERLKTLRNMSGLTIQELSEMYDIGASTIKYWESARSEGLSGKGARKIIEAMLDRKVYCTYMWLMHGIGIHPQILDVQYGSSQKQIDAMNSTFEEETSIANEIDAFLKSSQDAISLVVFEDAMEPLYNIGNTIGGVRLYGKDMVHAIGKDCIIETENGEILCRRIGNGNELSSYHLCALNNLTSVYPPNLYDVKIKSVAPISRVWKRIGISKDGAVK